MRRRSGIGPPDSRPGSAGLCGMLTVGDAKPPYAYCAAGSDDAGAERLMIDPASLIFLSIALVPGTADSIPSTEGMLFRVSIEPDVVAWFSYDNGYAGVGFKPGVSNQTVTIGLPAGLPLHGYLQNYTVIRYLGLDTTIRGYTAGECHTFVTVTINGSVDYYERILMGPRRIPSDTVPRSELHAEWLGKPWPPEPDPARIYSSPVPEGCGHVLAWPPFDPPRRQALAEGVLAGSVACNDGLVLRLREGGAGAGGYEPLCVRPGTADELVRRGVLEGDLPEPRGHRVRP